MGRGGKSPDVLMTAHARIIHERGTRNVVAWDHTTCIVERWQLDGQQDHGHFLWAETLYDFGPYTDWKATGPLYYVPSLTADGAANESRIVQIISPLQGEHGADTPVHVRRR